MASNVASLVFLATIAAIGLPPKAAPAGTHGERFRPETEKLSLIDDAAAQWNTVTRWRIEYEVVPIGASKARAFPVHRIEAVSAPGSLYSISAHFPGHPWQVDPYCQEYFIHQGRTCHQWPFNRTYSEGQLTKGDAIPGSIWKDVLLTVIPRWPLTDYKMPVDLESAAPIIPAEAMRSADCRVLVGSETIAGEDCAIFDRNGIDRIWIAAKKGLCVMRRDIRDARSGRLLSRIVTDKVDQVAPGFWLPIEYRNLIYSANQGTNEETIQLESMVRILRCDLNEKVPESTFIPIHRPGSLRYGKDNQFTQISPGGEDLLDDIVSFMVKYAKLPTKSFPHDHPCMWLLVGLASGACSGLLLLVSRSRTRLMKLKELVPESRKTETARGEE